jgi:thiol-disulfide isomerase/thioredoxin
MRKLIFIFLFLFALHSKGQLVSDMRFADFYKTKIENSKGIVVINFWATWCRPCVAELPYFERINSENKSDSFNVVLVNLDFNSKYKELAIPFVEKKAIKSDVVHINDQDPNEWINKMHEKWSGAIPATFIYQSGKQVFFKEGEMDYEELKKEISLLE